MLFLKVYLTIGVGFSFLILFLFDKFKHIDQVAEGIESMKKSLMLSLILLVLLVIGWLPIVIVGTLRN